METTGFNYPANYHPDLEGGSGGAALLDDGQQNMNPNMILPSTGSQFDEAKREGFTVLGMFLRDALICR